MFKKLVFGFLLILLITPCSAEEKELFKELKVTAEKGSPEAQYHLGMFYNNGIGTEKNETEALKWFKQAAEAGDPLGHYKLGCYYAGQAGDILPTDMDKALEHKLIAAIAGYALAQDDVAGMYYNKGDYEKAIQWWEQGVSQGDPYSFYKLFSIYYEGKVIPQNLEKSYWLLKIINRNSEGKERNITESKISAIKAKLTDEQINQLDEDVATWKPEPSLLTIKAKSGIEETRQIIKSSQKI